MADFLSDVWSFDGFAVHVHVCLFCCGFRFRIRRVSSCVLACFWQLCSSFALGWFRLCRQGLGLDSIASEMDVISFQQIRVFARFCPGQAFACTEVKFPKSFNKPVYDSPGSSAEKPPLCQCGHVWARSPGFLGLLVSQGTPPNYH